MKAFATKRLPEKPEVTAPDGSQVRILVALPRGSMAQFELAPGEVSRAVAHRTVEELWYFVSGSGRLWRKLGENEETVEVSTGLSISIPTGTSFQFRCDSTEPLRAVGVTMPPWPGEDEAHVVKGIWQSTVPGPSTGD